MWLEEASLMERQDFPHLECRDVFMWNVLSSQRWLSAFCGISRDLSLLLLSPTLDTLHPTDISFLLLKSLMEGISCACLACLDHLVESENVTKDNFSRVWWLKGEHLPPHLALYSDANPISANLTYGGNRERLSRLEKISAKKSPKIKKIIYGR